MRMSLYTGLNTALNNSICKLGGVFLILSECILLVHQPWENVLLKVTLNLGVEHAHGREGGDCALFKADQVFLGDDTGDVLLMSKFALGLPRLLLVSSPVPL